MLFCFTFCSHFLCPEIRTLLDWFNLFWGIFWSGILCEGTAWKQARCYDTVLDYWFSSQSITFNSVLHLSRAALQLLLLSEIKDYTPVCFPFLLSSICFIRQRVVTTGSCSSPALEVPRQLEHLWVFELRPFTLLGTASHGSPPSSGLHHSSCEVPLAVLLGSMLPFCGLLSSCSLPDFPIASVFQKLFSFRRTCLIMYLFTVLLADRTAFDLSVSKSIALARHVPQDPDSQARCWPPWKTNAVMWTCLWREKIHLCIWKSPVQFQQQCDWNSGTEAIPDIWQFN